MHRYSPIDPQPHTQVRQLGLWHQVNFGFRGQVQGVGTANITGRSPCMCVQASCVCKHSSTPLTRIPCKHASPSSLRARTCAHASVTGLLLDVEMWIVCWCGHRIVGGCNRQGWTRGRRICYVVYGMVPPTRSSPLPPSLPPSLPCLLPPPLPPLARGAIMQPCPGRIRIQAQHLLVISAKAIEATSPDPLKLPLSPRSPPPPFLYASSLPFPSGRQDRPAVADYGSGSDAQVQMFSRP
jgi:hypothetical protein